MTILAHNLIQDKILQPKRRVLVVDDERDIAELLVLNFQRAGYEAAYVLDGRSALERIQTQRPDLVVLDLMLPGLSGTAVASKIRTDPSTAGIPIVMLTAKADEVDQVVGLTIGADDYVTKPFSIKVLLARIEAVLRRSSDQVSPESVLRLGEVELNTQTHQAAVCRKPVRLTVTEFRLLAALIRGGGSVLSRSQLMTKAMGPGVTVTERTIDVHLTALRKKLGTEGDIIRTVRGVGYRAALEPEPAQT